MMNVNSPVFLVGAERSGTTLLRLMLDYHPQIAFNYEFEYAVEKIDDAGNWPDLPSYYEHLAYHRIFLDTGFSIDYGLDYPALVNSFLLQKRDNEPIVGATVHHKFHHLLKIWPQAKFIHIIRDGRDVARSNILMGWAGNILNGIKQWIIAENLWKKLSSKLTTEQHITIRYEDLIQAPQAELTKICEFIEVSFDKKMFDYAKHTTYDLPDSRIVERWRKQLTDYEIQLAESEVAPMLTARGYSLSGLPVLKITPWLRWRMYVQNRWYRILFRLRRYSFGLYLQDVLSRHLHLRNWQKQVRLRINAYDKKYLK